MDKALASEANHASSILAGNIFFSVIASPSLECYNLLIVNLTCGR